MKFNPLERGKMTRLAHGVRRLLAPNPGMMTGPGTNTYLIGQDQVAVIDPGPNMSEHIDAIHSESPGSIRWVLVTHTHPDHSPAAKVLAQRTGAELLGMRPPSDHSQDKSFEPDRVLKHGDVLETEEFVIEAIHTPGHASNHLCYRHQEHQWLFTGDHIMNGSTVVINPPDGNMNDYLNSLQRVKELKLDYLAPGHGEILDQPKEVVDWIVNHRLEREKKIVRALKDNPNTTSHDLVPFAYTDVDPGLYAWAERSLLAHLMKLQEDERAESLNEKWTYK